jgi:hypothetical protein
MGGSAAVGVDTIRGRTLDADILTRCAIAMTNLWLPCDGPEEGSDKSEPSHGGGEGKGLEVLIYARVADALGRLVPTSVRDASPRGRVVGMG